MDKKYLKPIIAGAVCLVVIIAGVTGVKGLVSSKAESTVKDDVYKVSKTQDEVPEASKQESTSESTSESATADLGPSATKPHTQVATSKPISTSAAKEKYISKDEACRIAIAKAGVNAANVTNCTAKLDCDKDKNTYKYEVEFVCDSYEYECDINPITGHVIHFEKEPCESEHDDHGGHHDHEEKHH